ncbi:acyltransferase [Lactobacillus hominis]|uniref:acyltransferase n=1 Tax=Lactobacillus hominis TaxID=1203033 RepID=UPI0023F1436A|nr:acyltransferase [Lactobacillus hominis]
MKTKHRNYGLDLVKIFACILVVTLHCLPPESSIVKNNLFNSSLYYSGTIAIPIFFMASSYFILNKPAISYTYVFKRIINILFIVLSWIFLYSIAYLIFKHNFDFLSQLKGSIFTGVPHQHFYHFWFFWALLISPLLWWLLQNHFNAYILLTVIITIICLAIDLLIHFGYTSLLQSTPQVFRLNIYIEYYLLGGLVGNIHFKRKSNYLKTRFFLFSTLTTLLYFLLIAYSLWNRNIIHWVYAEANYNNILVILTSTLALVLFAISSPKGDKFIEFIIPATMGIYMLHPFFIGKLSNMTLFHTYPSLMIILIFMLCLIIVEIALRVPIINRLFKL